METAPTEQTELYQSAYQTWTLVTKVSCAPTVPKSQAACLHATNGTPSKRAELQTARIKKRLSLSALSAIVHVDAETLSAFERGMDVLEPTIIKRMESLLLT